jgi:hypothetical protein
MQRFGNWICFLPQMVRYETSALLVSFKSNIFGSVIDVRSFQRTQQNMRLSPPHLRTETDPVTETLCLFEYVNVDKAQTHTNR